MAKKQEPDRVTPKPARVERDPLTARPIAHRSNETLPPRSPAPVHKDHPIKVRALYTGYYDHVRRREDDVFVIANEQAFSEKWMVRVDARTPERVTSAPQALKREHDNILGGNVAGQDDDPLND